jgi:hypothetical protein
MEQEIWAPIVSSQGKYDVSSFGRIRNTFTRKELKQSKTRKYCYVSMWYGHKRVRKTVSRLVAEAFIPNPDNKPQIDHIDRNRQNNSVNNLRWCTHSENMRNPKTIEHCRNLNLGRVYPTLRKPVVSIKNGIVVKQYGSIQEAVNDGFTRCGVSNCCAGRNPTHYGYKWMYLSDYKSLVNQ